MDSPSIALTLVVHPITRQEQYEQAKRLIESAETRLLLVEQTPTLLEKNIEKGKVDFRRVVIDAIEKAINTDFTFIHLISREQTRRELQFADGESRNFAVTQIYKLKSKQTSSENRFRFDFIGPHNIGMPLIVSDDKLVCWNVARPDVVLETRYEVENIADTFFVSYSNTDITSDLEMAALLDVQYDDREKVIVVDEDDNFLGVQPGVVAHIKRTRHRGIFVEFISSDGKILISRRSKTKSVESDKWDYAVSGHCDPEDLESGLTTTDFYINSAIREAEEELGLPLSRDKLRIKEKVKLDTESGENVIVQIFEMNSSDSCQKLRGRIKLNDGEVSETTCVTREELSNMASQGQLTDWLAEMVLRNNMAPGV